MKVVQEWLKSRSLTIKDGGGEGNGEKGDRKKQTQEEEPASGPEEAEGVNKSAPWQSIGEWSQVLSSLSCSKYYKYLVGFQ